MADSPLDTTKEARMRARDEEQINKQIRQEREAVKNLREILKQKNLAICVGSGVTLFSTRGNDAKVRARLTWTGLIRNGFDYLQREQPRFYKDNEKRFGKARDTLDDDDHTLEDVLHVASTLTQFMVMSREFADWLNTQFGTLYNYVKYPAILDSLKELHDAEAVLMTTNYDTLIECHCGLQPLDGSQSHQLVQFKRNEFTNVIFHPHGYWENAKQIVLDSRQYYDTQRQDNNVRQTLRAILKRMTVLFVGCGAGVADPNFGQLLQWLGREQELVSHGHYILLPKGDDYTELDYLPLKKVHVEEYEDIALWLKNLLDPSGRSENISE